MAVLQIETQIAMQRQRNQVKPAPIERPWEQPAERIATRRTRAEREAGRAKLRERLGITE